MLKWLRRQRLLAALLITANPALIGSWAAAYHPCPVRDGAVAAAQVDAPVVVDEHAGHEMAHEAAVPTPAHGHGDESATCSCIGQCLTAGIALPSFAGAESSLAVEYTQHPAPGTQHLVAPWASTPLDRLPPSTAPPIA
jgi:hypothetical protein